MYEADKISEAEYFLKRIAKCAGDRAAYKYNLSAFLSAARSVLYYARKEAKHKSRNHAWLKKHESASPVIAFLTDRRDVNIHREPLGPVKEIQVSIEETLHFGDSAEAIVIRDGVRVAGEPQQSASLVPEGTNWPYPSTVTMGEVYRFSEWTGPEDLPTLCSLYLTDLRKIVADGQSKRYLTP